MTAPYTTLPDGTRRYAGGALYKPLAPEQRKNKINRPDDPDAVRFHTRWFIPLAKRLKPDHLRYMPETIPDEAAFDHMEKYGARHMCHVCARPQAMKHVRRWLRANGFTS